MTMKKDSSTESWNNLGDAWIELAQTNDFRIFYLMPHTFRLLGDVKGKKVLDLGCGEGGYARELRKRGAEVTGIDCSQAAIAYAKAVEEQQQSEDDFSNIQYFLRNSNDLNGIGNNLFDLVLCSMMLMDVEDMTGTLREMNRVLKPNGQVLISILHPCFKPPVEHHWFHEKDGIQVKIKNYFSPEVWEDRMGREGKSVLYRHRTLSEYVKAFVNTGFLITDLNEPFPTEEETKKSPRIEWLTRIPMYMFFTLRKTGI